jgi:ceramide glucosyltransferase
VRVRPDYLRTVVAPLADPKVGAVTCFYVPIEDKTLTDSLQTIGMFSDFYAGILVARQLDGVKFALGPTIATTRARLAGFGGYGAIKNRPADDLLVGRLIAEQGCEVELLALHDFDGRRLRVAERPSPQTPALDRGHAPHAALGTSRPAAHAGVAVVFGSDCDPSLSRSCAGLSRRVPGLRFAMTWMVGIWGLKQDSLWKKLGLIPVWDAWLSVSG